MDISGSTSNTKTTVRETVMRQSFVFSGASPASNRSFISTSLVNDSYAFNDDLRKYIDDNLDHVFRIYPITRKLIQDRIFNLLLCSRQQKFKDFPMNLKSLELDLKKIKDRCSIIRIIKSKLENLLRSALGLNANARTIGIKLINLAKFVRLSITRMRASSRG